DSAGLPVGAPWHRRCDSSRGREGGVEGSMVGAHRLTVLAAVVLILITAAVTWRLTSRSDAPAPVVKSATAAPPWVRGETRPTLDPARVVGKAALAHRVARETPDTLDRLYCYCECDKPSGHKSLLSCYTDGHAAT